MFFLHFLNRAGHSFVSRFCQWKAVPLNPSRLSCWNTAEFAVVSFKLSTGLPLPLIRTESVPRKKKKMGFGHFGHTIKSGFTDLSAMVIRLWAAPRVSLEAHLCRDQKLHLSTGSHRVSSADSQNMELGHRPSHRAEAAETPQQNKHQRKVLQHTVTFWSVPGS